MIVVTAILAAPENKRESKTLKAIFLSFKAQSSVARASTAEVRQLNGKQIEFLEKLVDGFQTQAIRPVHRMSLFFVAYAVRARGSDSHLIVCSRSTILKL